MLPPGAITAGVNVTVGTVRSGRSTVSVPVRNVLLLSSASMTAPLALAVTLILYAPSVVPAGMVTAFAKAIVSPAAKLTPVRLGPIGMSLPPVWGNRAKATSKLVAAWPPWFVSVYITLTFIPGVAVATVLAALRSTSGPTMIGVASVL